MNLINILHAQSSQKKSETQRGSLNLGIYISSSTQERRFRLLETIHCGEVTRKYKEETNGR